MISESINSKVRIIAPAHQNNICPNSLLFSEKIFISAFPKVAFIT